eukprot:1481482-Prymnesium_polylepis.1
MRRPARGLAPACGRPRCSRRALAEGLAAATTRHRATARPGGPVRHRAAALRDARVAAECGRLDALPYRQRAGRLRTGGVGVVRRTRRARVPAAFDGPDRARAARRGGRRYTVLGPNGGVVGVCCWACVVRGVQRRAT